MLKRAQKEAQLDRVSGANTLPAVDELLPDYFRTPADYQPVSRREYSLLESIRTLNVFLCHASNDKSAVRQLYTQLQNSSVHPWLDEEELLAGQEWQVEISKAVKNSDVVIVCLSKEAINKRGFVQKELKFALDVADEQPEGTIFLIPLRLEECEVPERLRRWHWVNLFDERGYDLLIRSLQSRARTLNVRVPRSLR